MAYVTEDPRVQEIVARYAAGDINRGQAAAEIKELPPQEPASPWAAAKRHGYLDWEVEEALK